MSLQILVNWLDKQFLLYRVAYNTRVYFFIGEKALGQLGDDLPYDLFLGIVMGNPGVFYGYPDPTRQEPIPSPGVWVLRGWGQGFEGSHGLQNPSGLIKI